MPTATRHWVYSHIRQKKVQILTVEKLERENVDKLLKPIIKIWSRLINKWTNTLIISVSEASLEEKKKICDSETVQHLVDFGW